MKRRNLTWNLLKTGRYSVVRITRKSPKHFVSFVRRSFVRSFVRIRSAVRNRVLLILLVPLDGVLDEQNNSIGVQQLPCYAVLSGCPAYTRTFDNAAKVVTVITTAPFFTNIAMIGHFTKKDRTI